AIDFVLTGTLTKYDVKAAKGGGLNDHIWWVGDGKAEEEFVRVGFQDEDGNEFTITRSRKHGIDRSPEEIGAWLCGQKRHDPAWVEVFLKTSLIRDETISALSLDLPEQARFASVRGAIGGVTGSEHSNRVSSLVRAATEAIQIQELQLKS